MGKILVKAQQQNVFNKDKSGVTSKAYVLRPVRYSTMRSEDIINYCAANSIVPKAYMNAALTALSQCIENFLLNGHSVEFPSLGIFVLSSNGISEVDVNKAGIDQLIKLKLRFLPCTRLKNVIDNVDLEFDGVYDIAGENADGEKYYKKVTRHLSVGEDAGNAGDLGDDGDDGDDDDTSNPGDNGNSGTGGAGGSSNSSGTGGTGGSGNTDDRLDG